MQWIDRGLRREDRSAAGGGNGAPSVGGHRPHAQAGGRTKAHDFVGAVDVPKAHGFVG